MWSRWCVVEIMRCNYLIFDTSMKQLQNILVIHALKHEEILNNELLLLGPPDPETLLVTGWWILLRITGKTWCIEEIVHSFVIDLKERTKYRNVLAFFFFYAPHFLTQIHYCSLGYTHILTILFYNWSLCNSWWRILTSICNIIVTFHCKCFPRTSLSISKDCSMVTLNNNYNFEILYYYLYDFLDKLIDT